MASDVREHERTGESSWEDSLGLAGAAYGRTTRERTYSMRPLFFRKTVALFSTLRPGCENLMTNCFLFPCGRAIAWHVCKPRMSCSNVFALACARTNDSGLGASCGVAGPSCTNQLPARHTSRSTP